MKKPTEQQKKAMRRLMTLDDFVTFTDWIEESLLDNDKKLRKVAPCDLGLYQGISNALETIIKYGTR